jgi:DNA (cytosine-5)-methyltransferase 1
VNLYNEIDPYAAQWLRNLIDAGHIPPGVVDERSIVDLDPDELRGFTQCHFFAGIGGWSYALRLAGWPDDRPVWTGSCPCQPFSQAGAQRGSDDERHLWPAFFRLIGECRPAIVFGEQVAGAAGLAWLDHVCADLEGAGYATAAANLPACSVGADHIRERLWWVAHANGERCAQPGDDRSDASNHTPSAPWEANRFLDAVRSDALPLVCRKHDGIPASVGAMRAYGNAIVPQVAAVFVRAV